MDKSCKSSEATKATCDEQVKRAHGKFNTPIVKLAPAFYVYVGVFEIGIRADNIGTSIEQKKEPSESRI